MNKMNKKGFTLIEMLVVIAIIAILVSIIIPAVSSSTKRAAAATDAANLRSAKAVISIGLLDGTYKKNTAKGVITAEKCGVPNESKYDESKTFSAAIDGEGNVYVAYGELTIEDLADLADDGQDNGTVTGGALAPDNIGGSGPSSGGGSVGCDHTGKGYTYDANGTTHVCKACGQNEETCTNTEEKDCVCGRPKKTHQHVYTLKNRQDPGYGSNGSAGTHYCCDRTDGSFPCGKTWVWTGYMQGAWSGGRCSECDKS